MSLGLRFGREIAPSCRDYDESPAEDAGGEIFTLFFHYGERKERIVYFWYKIVYSHQKY